jgi:hypothetical protein
MGYFATIVAHGIVHVHKKSPGELYAKLALFHEQYQVVPY